MKLIEQNINVVGSLNPAILQPNWLVKQGLIPKGETLSVKIQVGSYFSTEYDWKNNFRWSADRSRLKVNISPESDPNNLKKFISTVFEKLEHTPVTAIGQNFIFEGEPDKVKTDFFCRNTLALNDKTKWGVVARLKNEVTLSRDEICRINIYLINEYDKSKVHINYHYDVTLASEVVKFAGEIKDNLEQAKEIIKEVSNL